MEPQPETRGMRWTAHPAIPVVLMCLLVVVAYAGYFGANSLNLWPAPPDGSDRVPTPPAAGAGGVTWHVPTVAAEKASDYVERFCAVRMTCAHASPEGDGSVALHPETKEGVPPFRAVLTPDALADFHAADIDPLTFFSGLGVRVTGRVRDRGGRYEVVVPAMDLVRWADSRRGGWRAKEAWTWDGRSD